MSSATQEAILLQLEAAQRFTELMFDDGIQQKDSVCVCVRQTMSVWTLAVCMQKQIMFSYVWSQTRQVLLSLFGLAKTVIVAAPQTAS